MSFVSCNTLPFHEIAETQPEQPSTEQPAEASQQQDAEPAQTTEGEKPVDQPDQVAPEMAEKPDTEATTEQTGMSHTCTCIHVSNWYFIYSDVLHFSTIKCLVIYLSYVI